MKRDITQTFATVFGAIFLLLGIVGFILTGLSATGATLIVFGLNPLHNLAHLLIGGLWLLSARRADTARVASQVIGLVYLVLGVVGFFEVNGAVNALALNTADNILHIVTGAAAFYVGSVISRDQASDFEATDSDTRELPT